MAAELGLVIDPLIASRAYLRDLAAADVFLVPHQRDDGQRQQAHQPVRHVTYLKGKMYRDCGCWPRHPEHSKPSPYRSHSRRSLHVRGPADLGVGSLT